jgi:hypothetical protein
MTQRRPSDSGWRGDDLGACVKALAPLKFHHVGEQLVIENDLDSTQTGELVELGLARLAIPGWCLTEKAQQIARESPNRTEPQDGWRQGPLT